MGTALIFAALPMGYAAEHGAEALSRTSDFATKHLTRRVAETGQMLIDVMGTRSPDNLDPGGSAHATAVGLRLLHGCVRALLTEEPRGWQTKVLGTPLNQEIMVATLMDFTVVTWEAMERIGVDLSPEDRRAHLYTWSVIGALMGLDACQPGPLTLADADQISAALHRQLRATEGGRLLMAALLRELERMMPLGLRKLPRSTVRWLFAGAPNGVRTVPDLLGVPPSAWWSGRAFHALRATNGVTLRGPFRRPIDRFRQRAGRLVFTAFADGWAHGGSAFQDPGSATALLAHPHRSGHPWDPHRPAQSPRTRAGRRSPARPTFPDPWRQMTYPTAEEIRTIAVDDTRSFADEADVIANAYYRLAIAMAERLGRHDLNWCGFAMWSSTAIGASLRLENDSPFWARARTAFRVPRILAVPFRVILRVLLGGSYSRGLSIANRSIFLELGTFFANLLTDSQRVAILENGALRNQTFAHPLIEQLTERQKDDLLRVAELIRSAEQTSGVQRSELILAANVALTALEQERVQPVLEYVLYRPVRWMTRVSWRIPLHCLRRRPLKRFGIYTAPHAEQPVVTRWLEGVWSRGYVRALALRIPGGQVVVGCPLERPASPPSPLFDGITDGRAATTIARFHTDAQSRLDGARDWLDYEDRMRFIVSYFMIYQNDERMFDDPRATPKPARKTTELAVACTQWVSRTLQLPRFVDPMMGKTQAAVEPTFAEIGELRS